MSRLFTLLMASLTLLAAFFAQGMAQSTSIAQNQQQFINYLLPKIERNNLQVLQQRRQLLALRSQYMSHRNLKPSQIRWLNDLAMQYGVEDARYPNTQFWNELSQRVDVIPTPLALAQAINESGWGKSRFARLGHNYFGIWCHSPGCGIVPNARPKHRSFEVRSYNNAYASVKNYMHLLNTKNAYRKLRRIRAESRTQGEPLSSIAMANGLQHYSIHGTRYINSIKSIIVRYNLNAFRQFG